MLVLFRALYFNIQCFQFYVNEYSIRWLLKSNILCQNAHSQKQFLWWYFASDFLAPGVVIMQASARVKIISAPPGVMIEPPGVMIASPGVMIAPASRSCT